MEMAELKKTMISGHNRVIREVTTNFGEELDNRAVGGGEFGQMTSLLVKLHELLTRLNNPVLPAETAANKENAIGGIIEANYDVFGVEEEVVVTVDEQAILQQDLIRQRTREQMERRTVRVGFNYSVVYNS